MFVFYILSHTLITFHAYIHIHNISTDLNYIFMHATFMQTIIYLFNHFQHSFWFLPLIFSPAYFSRIHDLKKFYITFD